MFTDIEGYTASMQRNEQKAVAARDRHRQILNSKTEAHNGRILQYFGDGTLSIFDSAIDAVQCGIEMQLAFQQDPLIPVRIGVHTGDIILTDDDIIGDGVNVASRIESLAVPGSVFISDKVFDEIKNQSSIQTTKLKTFKLKNVERPMDVYAISNDGLVVPELEEIKGKVDVEPSEVPRSNGPERSGSRRKISMALLVLAVLAALLFSYQQFFDGPDPVAEIPERSIAVLAFENMSGDPEQEYFSDGISEEILNSLANIEGLKVAGRTSAFSFKGKDEDIRTIGKELDVKLVLEGSVRKVGDHVRITAQLINVEDGFHLWSETYDRELEDIFAVQQDIAERIVEKLKLQVRKQGNGGGGTLNMEAYDLFLKGIYFHSKDFLSAEKAMQCFEKAVELDPEYSEAYALIAEIYIVYAGYGLMPPTEGYAKARIAALKAIGINAKEPRAHKALAYVHLTADWDWEAALSEYNKAVEYGLPEPDQFITYYKVFIEQDFDQALSMSEELAQNDPLNIGVHWHLGLMNYFAEKFEDALVSFNNTLELDPSFSEGHHWKGLVLGYLGRYDEAVRSLEKALEISHGVGPANTDLLIVKLQMGKKEEVLKVLEEWEVSDEHIAPMDPAMLYSLLGMNDRAIYWLEESYQERATMTVSLKFLWVWDPIRDDPRFIEIYNRMNFPE